jgi:hypothetical protein
MKCDYCDKLPLYQCPHALMCEKHMREHFEVYDKCKTKDFNLFWDNNGIKHMKG